MTPFDSLTHLLTAAGALGTAAFGLVEAAKGTTPLGVAGLRGLEKALGRTNLRALHRTYGKDGWDHILRGAYRKGDAALMQVLRDGLKLALGQPEDKEFAKALNVDPGKLEAALQTFRESQVEGARVDEARLQEGRRVLGTAELTLNAWVEGAVATAMSARVGWTQCWAGIVAVLGALAVAALTPPLDGDLVRHLGKALLLGIVAVPIAPISKDLVSLLKAAKEAVGRR